MTYDPKEPGHVTIASLLWHVIGEEHLKSFLHEEQGELANSYGIRLIKDVQEDRYIKVKISGFTCLRKDKILRGQYNKKVTDLVIKVLDVKLKEVPLYINCEDDLAQALAKKRLEIGR